MKIGKQPVNAVILDWAGTTIDHGSCAPARVFVEMFRAHGLEVTDAEARGPMGRAKREHIATVLALPRIGKLWQSRFGRIPNDDDVQAMYDDFLPLQKNVLAEGADVIAGVTTAIAELRSRGIKIGSTTGFTRDLMTAVLPAAARQGYSPEVVICSDDVPAGRPAPWMNFLAAQRLGVYPMESIVVVDDTPVGIEAALNAGAIAVAVTQTGNALALSAEQVTQLADEDLRERLRRIESDFRALGAHYVLKSVADLPAVL